MPRPLNEAALNGAYGKQRLSTGLRDVAPTWDMLKNELRDILAQEPSGESETWLECLTLRQEKDTLRVGFPHVYFAAWFARHKRAVFEDALSRRFIDTALPEIIYERTVPVLTLQAGQTAQEAGLPDNVQKSVKARPAEGESAHGAPQSPAAEDIFAAFISNAKNAFPLAAARKIAEKKAGEAYNPFLLCGRSGTGKSHLLRAMTSAMCRHNGPERIIHTGAARFCAENTSWARRPELFWRQCRALLLDDIQDLAEQPAWQQKLAACMDACPRDAQMVFAWAGPARSLKALDERLHSRLESGLVVELMEPDLDVRLRYLQILCKERQLGLNREQLLFLAQRCAQLRLLQGLLLKVKAFCAVHGRSLTPADLENIVRTGGAERPPGCREILGEVARGLNLRVEDILGGKRRPDLVLARQLAMYLCRQKLGLSYPELGRAFGGRDHSTVIHAIKKIKKLMISDKDVQRLVTELETKVS